MWFIIGILVLLSPIALFIVFAVTHKGGTAIDKYLK